MFCARGRTYIVLTMSAITDFTYSLLVIVTTFTCSLPFTGCAATVILTSRIEDQGRVVACPGEEVVFTCRTTDSALLVWDSDQFSNPQGFRFLPTDQNTQRVDGDFTATLTEVIANPDNMLFANFTSTLAVTATVDLNGTVIECNDLQVLENQTLLVADMPSPPLNPRSVVQTYHCRNFTVRVEWEDSTLGADTYTISSDIPSMETVPGNETSVILTISYNMMHTVTITATLCGDVSEAAAVDITAVSCGDPTPPSNGSIGDYDSTAEAAQVNYQCDDGLIPGGEMMTTCLADGTWSPDPAELECAEPPPTDCGYPDPPVNGSFGGDITSTVEGSEITYQCDDGLTPEGTMTAVCGEDGEWRPNPGDVECQKNDCSKQDESKALSSGAVISIAVVVTFVVAFTLGNITGALVHYCITCTVRRKSCFSTKQEPLPPAPEYEQVSLEQRNIELRENVAYGPI